MTSVKPIIFILVTIFFMIGMISHVNMAEAVSGHVQEESVENLSTITSDIDTASYLLFNINFIYRPQGAQEFKILTNESILYSGNYYKIIFTPTIDCYVYIFQFDSANMMLQLFPMESMQGITLHNVNPVQAGKSYHIPDQKKSFILDDKTGTETIYFLASQQQEPVLEEHYERIVQIQQQKEELKKEIEGIDHVITYAMELKGLTSLLSEPAATETFTFKEEKQAFSTLQRHLESMCDGCVYVITFEHK